MTNVWPLGLFDCVTYRDPVNHRNHFFPNFCPQGGPRSIVITSRFHLLTLLILRNIHIFLLALFGQCCIEGEIYTILNDQTPCCLNMSGGGWMCCLMTLPPAIFGPFGGLFVNVCCGVRTRQEIMKKYDMLPEPSRYNMTLSLIFTFVAVPVDHDACIMLLFIGFVFSLAFSFYCCCCSTAKRCLLVYAFLVVSFKCFKP